MDWTEDEVNLPPIPAKVLRSRVLSSGKAEVRQTAKDLVVSVPAKDRQPIDTVVALELDGPAMSIPAVDVPEPVSLTTKARVTASNVYHNQAEFGPEKAVDGRSDTRWATDPKVRTAYHEVDFGKPSTFRRARISEAFPNRVQKFQMEYLQDTQWKIFLTGTNIGEAWSRNFTPVTAQKVRLTIIEASEGPTIWEFSLSSNARSWFRIRAKTGNYFGFGPQSEGKSPSAAKAVAASDINMRGQELPSSPPFSRS